MITLNREEIAALERNLPLIDEGESERVESLTLERRDSLDNPCDDGFLIVRVEFADGGWAEDAISSTGQTSIWRAKP